MAETDTVVLPSTLKMSDTGQGPPMSEANGEAPTKWICKQCGMETTSGALLELHVKAAHDNPLPELKCRKCEFRSFNKVDLCCHVKIVHGTVVKRRRQKPAYKGLACNQCSFRTYYPSHLKEHVKSIHDKIKDLVCDICGFKTGRKSHLKEHIKVIHHNIRDHACSLCNYTTTRNWLLKDHIKAVHDKVKDLTCDTCGYRTANLSNLRNHVKQAHANRKDFACEQCDYRTYHGAVLQNHIKQVHRNVFDFICEMCPYKTNTEVGMINHVEAVHKEQGKFVPDEEGKTPNPSVTARNVANNNEHRGNAQKAVPVRPPPAQAQLPAHLADKVVPQVFPKVGSGELVRDEPTEPDQNTVPLAFKREYDAAAEFDPEELVGAGMDYDYDYEDAYEPYEDTFKMEEDDDDPEFDPEELLEQEMDTVPSPTDGMFKKEEEFAADAPVVVKGEPQTSPSDIKVTKCHLCEYVAENRTKFTAHMKSEHGTASKKTGGSPAVVKEKNFSCDREDCDYKATSKAHLKDHIRAIHDKIKAFACNQCSFRSSRKTHLKDHVKTQHDMIKDFACEQCDYKTTRGRLLRDHVKAIHDKILDSVCEICGYRTADAANLKRHVLAKHSTKRDFACEQCEYKTYKNSNLQYHIKAVHLKIFDFVCDICGYATSQKGTLNLHIKTVHKPKAKKEPGELERLVAEYVQECDDGFICLECSKTFAQKDLKKRKGFMRKKGHMLRHIKEVHMSPEQYECPPCGVVFKNREFYSHVKENHPEWLGVSLEKFKISPEQYECTPCGITFKTRAFYKHVRRVHPDWRGVSLSKFKVNSS